MNTIFVSFSLSGAYLVQDVGSREVSLEALLAGLTEQTVHLAAHLRRNAQRGAVAVGDIHRLHELSAPRGEEILYRSVFRLLAVCRLHAAHAVSLLELLAVGLRDVCHPVNVLHALFIEPFGHLSAGECRHSELPCGVLEFIQCLSYEWCLAVCCHIHVYSLCDADNAIDMQRYKLFCM